VFPSVAEAAGIFQPGKEPLNFPSPGISSEFPPILGGGFFPVRSMGRNQADSSFAKSRIKSIIIVCLITNDSSWRSADETVIKGPFSQFAFVNRGCRNMKGDRKTMAVCHCHDLGPFPALRRSNIWTPLFAPAKVASMKHSERSIFPRRLRSSASAFKSVSITPSRTHFWNHRWQVWYGGYLGRSSTQGAPVRMIQRMPLRTSLGFLGGRPRSVPFIALGIKPSINRHCSSLRSILGSFGTHKRSKFAAPIPLIVSDPKSTT